MVRIEMLTRMLFIKMSHFSPRVSETCIVATSKTETVPGLTLLTIISQVTMATSRGCAAGKTSQFLSVSTMTLSASAGYELSNLGLLSD